MAIFLPGIVQATIPQPEPEPGQWSNAPLIDGVLPLAKLIAAPNDEQGTKFQIMTEKQITSVGLSGNTPEQKS